MKPGQTQSQYTRQLKKLTSTTRKIRPKGWFLRFWCAA